MIRNTFMRFPGGREKAVTLSYDDGVVEDKRFSDVITKHGLKCTFNLNGRECRSQLSVEEVKTYMLDRGHEVAVHGYNHRAPGSLRAIEGIRDVLDCRLELERDYGIIIRGMAYPNWGVTRFSGGTNYEMVKNYLTELDITYARSLGGDNDCFEMPADWHNWMPTVHHNNPKIFEYIEDFLAIEMNPKQFARPRLFYLWGHAYEFDRNDNWDLLDRICEAISGRDDIWYATNGEIYEYTKAYESLVYSADGHMIYNPTLFEIFFVVDGKNYSIKPGETLKI